AHAGVERFVDEIDLEAEPVTVERNRSIEVVDEELRGDPGDHCSAANRCVRHLTPRRQSCRGPAPGHRWRRSWAVGTHAMSIAVARARRQNSNSPWFAVHVRWLTGALDGRRLDSRATGRGRFGRDRCPSLHNGVGCRGPRRSALFDEDDRPRDAPIFFAFYLSIHHMSLTIWLLNNYASWAVTADFLFALCLACASESPDIAYVCIKIFLEFSVSLSQRASSQWTVGNRDRRRGVWCRGPMDSGTTSADQLA